MQRRSQSVTQEALPFTPKPGYLADATRMAGPFSPFRPHLAREKIAQSAIADLGESEESDQSWLFGFDGGFIHAAGPAKMKLKVLRSQHLDVFLILRSSELINFVRGCFFHVIVEIHIVAFYNSHLLNARRL